MTRQEVEERTKEGESVFHFRFDEVKWSPVWTEIRVIEVTDTHVIGRISDEEQQDWSIMFPIEQVRSLTEYSQAMDCQTIDDNLVRYAI